MEGSEEGEEREEDKDKGQTDTDSDSNYFPTMASPPFDLPPPHYVTLPLRDLLVPRIAGKSDKHHLADRPKKSRRGSPTIFDTTPSPCNGNRLFPPSARLVAIVPIIHLKLGDLNSQKEMGVSSPLAIIYGAMQTLLLLWR
ncbi:hypothetical protein ACFXTO_024744 [Malus domestica]